jgi:hypothetical protein
MEARPDDPARALKWPSLELLIPFSKALEINYKELFIPEDCIKIVDLIPVKKKLFEYLMRINDMEILGGIMDYIITVTDNKIKEVARDAQEKQTEYKYLLNLLEDSN